MGWNRGAVSIQKVNEILGYARPRYGTCCPRKEAETPEASPCAHYYDTATRKEVEFRRKTESPVLNEFLAPSSGLPKPATRSFQVALLLLFHRTTTHR